MTRGLPLAALAPIALAALFGMAVGILHAPVWLSVPILIAWGLDAGRQVASAITALVGDHDAA